MNLTSRTGRLLQVVSTLGLLLAASCATLAAVEANKRVPGTLADGVLTPARPPARDFGADPARTCPTGAPYDDVAGRIASSVKDRGAVEVQADGRLCAVAEALLSWPSDEVPVHVRAFLGRYFGLAANPPELALVTMETDDPRQMAERLAETIQSYGARVTNPRYGLAVVAVSRRRGGDKATQDETKAKTRLIIALYTEPVVLQPLPRRLEPGAKATVAGTLAGDLDAPKLLLSDVQGKLTTVEPAAGSKAFKAEIACGKVPGRIFVEVRGEELGSERVIEAFAVACATPLPTSVAVAAPASWTADAAVQEKKIEELINAERTGAGLPALAWLGPVGKIARAVSDSLRDGGQKGAVMVPVNIVQRLTEADITALVVLQNPAAGPSAEVAHDRLMASPTHRANIMSTEVTSGGIGVALGTDAAGKPVAYLTELFVKVQAPPDVAAMRQTIDEVIARKRAAEKLPALVVDPALEKLAADYVVAVAAAGGPPPKAVTDAFEKELKKGYKDVVLMRDARFDLNDYAEDPNLLSKGKLMGLGTALGRHPRLGKNTLFVVLVIANKLPAKK